LFRIGDSVKASIRDHDGLKFAIWFHDAIYRTRRKDNEERSAELASQSLQQLGVPVETKDLVCGMILATKDHLAAGSSDDLKLFLDLDLSILGSDGEVYQRYSEAIRREYWWVPSSVYREGRRAVLASFLNRESIYYTEEISRRYEQQARRNIEHEIDSLLTGTRK
jgi:predicted metal-dependent HD superfamily phosphohydrolase